jgi:DNA-binding NtrC family response regulator
VQRGTFREDLYYRLNTVPIHVPPLRDRKDDILLLYRKFAQDAADRYRIKDPITLAPDAQQMLTAYRWPGNVRQLKNIVEQMSVIEQDRRITADTLRTYLPEESTALVPAGGAKPGLESLNERELIFKFLFDMKNDLNALKEQVRVLMTGQPLAAPVAPVVPEIVLPIQGTPTGTMSIQMPRADDPHDVEHTEVHESLSLQEKEKELIKKALARHRNRRKAAAQELGISERTLYRKIKEYDLQ